MSLSAPAQDRQSSTQVIYQSSAKLVGIFRSKASETIHPPAMGNGYVEIASPVPLPVGRRNNFKGGSQPPFFFMGLAVGLARSRAAPLLRRSEGPLASACSSGMCGGLSFAAISSSER